MFLPLGQLLSDTKAHSWGMNRWKRWTWAASNDHLIARFGTASLVRCKGRRYELRGGNDGDLAAAREWVAHFLHEAVIDRPTASQPTGYRSKQPQPVEANGEIGEEIALTVDR